MAIYSNDGRQVTPGWNRGMHKANSKYYKWAVIHTTDSGGYGYIGEVAEKFPTKKQAENWIDQTEPSWQSDYAIKKL